MNQPSCDIAIIDAGAAGLAAAIFAAEHSPHTDIVVLDSARKAGAKILVSGGGRCNVTHQRVRLEDFHGPRHLIRHILAAFDEHKTVSWFESLGVTLKREATGKLFPVTDSARTVLSAPLKRCETLNICLRPQHRGHEIHTTPTTARQEIPRIIVAHEQGTLAARRVILATGGRSLPRTGRDGTGWRIARSPGHRGWNYVEVTAAGVPLGEINHRTMESRPTPGLYLAGEILDCDGRIGGFNFQWAWATEWRAAAPRRNSFKTMPPCPADPAHSQRTTTMRKLTLRLNQACSGSPCLNRAERTKNARF